MSTRELEAEIERLKQALKESRESEAWRAERLSLAEANVERLEAENTKLKSVIVSGVFQKYLDKAVENALMFIEQQPDE